MCIYHCFVLDSLLHKYYWAWLECVPIFSFLSLSCWCVSVSSIDWGVCECCIFIANVELVTRTWAPCHTGTSNITLPTFESENIPSAFVVSTTSRFIRIEYVKTLIIFRWSHATPEIAKIYLKKSRKYTFPVSFFNAINGYYL